MNVSYLKDEKKSPLSLAAILAHEVRNPLTNINLSVEMMLSVMKDDKAKVYLDIILRNSKRIDDLINQMLSFQQSDEILPEYIFIHQLLDSVLDLAIDRITLKDIAVVKDYTEEDCRILLNSPKMKIALTNIIINAIDAMAPATGVLRLRTMSTENTCIIYIEDNGCGISKDNLKYIFEPYFTNKTQGMGLGLSATLDILFSNHVKVNVQSDEGKGTCFILSFEKLSQQENSF